VAPDATRETFSEATEHGGGEDEGGRRARYLQWRQPPASGGAPFDHQQSIDGRSPERSPKITCLERFSRWLIGQSVTTV
jgi:hypothetical protein